MPPPDAGEGRELTCPRCGAGHEAEERLCRRCRMPLTVPGGEQAELSSDHGEARKIDPRYARGELVRIAVGRNQPDAELIKGVLLEQGIPSMLRRTGGFDVPDFLAAGPRDVLVPASAAEDARALLGEAAPDPDTATAPRPRELSLRLLAALLALLLLFGAVAGVVFVLAP